MKPRSRLSWTTLSRYYTYYTIDILCLLNYTILYYDTLHYKMNPRSRLSRQLCPGLSPPPPLSLSLSLSLSLYCVCVLPHSHELSLTHSHSPPRTRSSCTRYKTLTKTILIIAKEPYCRGKRARVRDKRTRVGDKRARVRGSRARVRGKREWMST